MLYKVWTIDEEAPIILKDNEDETAYHEACNWCFNKCFQHLEDLAFEKKITNAEWRKEKRYLVNWYKNVKNYESPAEMFMVCGENYAFLRRV